MATRWAGSWGASWGSTWVYDYVEYGISLDIQKFSPGALVEFFEIDLSPIGVDAQYYFHNDVNELGSDVVWQGQVYTRFPIEADGFEWNGTGAQPRPKVRVGNITGLLGALARENEDLVGVKFIRKRTFLKYLDAVNFASGNPTADANVHFTDEVWYVDRKASENRVFVEWELTSAGDLTGVMLPRRQCIQNTCTWRYRSAECGYSGPAVADINDVPTTNINLDACGKRLSSCNFRYPDEKPFGGFPAVGLIR
jgi:lambda family phage minor tail protein L